LTSKLSAIAVSPARLAATTGEVTLVVGGVLGVVVGQVFLPFNDDPSGQIVTLPAASASVV
jgi:hypothetical protein